MNPTPKSRWKKAKLVWADLSQRMLVLTRWKPRPDVGPHAAERIGDRWTYDVTEEYWSAVDGEIKNVLKALVEAAKREVSFGLMGPIVVQWLRSQDVRRKP